jgi:hypothetical protein
MNRLIVLAALIACLLVSAGARAAEQLGTSQEQILTTKARVVDLACELTGSCPANCGDGKRQLGLLTPEGKLLVAAKGYAIFIGAVPDLLPHCGQTIWVDGLTTSQFGTTLFMVQRLKDNEGDEWRDADQGLQDWSKAHRLAPDSDQAKEWYRHDDTVAAEVAKRGKLGVPE